MRIAAAYVMKFAIASASLAACYRSSNPQKIEYCLHFKVI